MATRRNLMRISSRLWQTAAVSAVWITIIFMAIKYKPIYSRICVGEPCIQRFHKSFATYRFPDNFCFAEIEFGTRWRSVPTTLVQELAGYFIFARYMITGSFTTIIYDVRQDRIYISSVWGIENLPDEGEFCAVDADIKIVSKIAVPR